MIGVSLTNKETARHFAGLTITANAAESPEITVGPEVDLLSRHRPLVNAHLRNLEGSVMRAGASSTL